MKLSISNIAWSKEYDIMMYKYLTEHNFIGLEIAPTRIFPEAPYDKLEEARSFAKNLKEQYNLVISSMQSIWYGRSENIFNSDGERKILVDYTKKAIDFASVINCKNLVFGCPKNRVISDESQYNKAVSFFRSIGEYAIEKGTTIAIEPNPPIYNTNFINTTSQAFELVRNINCDGVMVNADLGTIIYNEEKLQIVAENISLVNHFHLSEPYLEKIQKREANKELKYLKYNKFISVEMKNFGDIEFVKETINYVSELFKGR